MATTITLALKRQRPGLRPASAFWFETVKLLVGRLRALLVERRPSSAASNATRAGALLHPSLRGGENLRFAFLFSWPAGRAALPQYAACAPLRFFF